MTIDKYTKFILALIALGLFLVNIQLYNKNEFNLISKAHAIGVSEIEGLETKVRKIVETKCQVKGTSRRITCSKKK